MLNGSEFTLCWSTFKWWVYLLDKREDFRGRKASFFEEHNLIGNTVPKSLAKEWAYVSASHTIPQARHHKGKIVRWIIHWPTNVIYFLLNDLFRRIANTIYNAINSVFQGMANFIFKNEKVDVEK